MPQRLESHHGCKPGHCIVAIGEKGQNATNGPNFIKVPVVHDRGPPSHHPHPAELSSPDSCFWLVPAAPAVRRLRTRCTRRSRFWWRGGVAAKPPGTPQAEWEAAVKVLVARSGARRDCPGRASGMGSGGQAGSAGSVGPAWVVREVGEPARPTRPPTGTPLAPIFQRTPMLQPSWMARQYSGQPSLSQTVRLRPSEVSRKATGIIARAKTACSRVATREDRRMLAPRFCSANGA